MKNNKYIIFPIIMLCFTILASIYTYKYQYFKQYDTIINYDITGNTKIFFVIFLIIELCMLGLCIYIGKKAKNEGYKYSLNKLFAAIFLVLTIVPIISFISIRNEEEKQAKILDEKIEILYEDTININDKKTKAKLNEIQELQKNDKFYSRKREIYNEMNNENSKFKRYLTLFIYMNYHNEESINESGWYNKLPSQEEIYYATFTVFTIINLICFGFYLINIKDEKFEIKTKI